MEPIIKGYKSAGNYIIELDINIASALTNLDRVVTSNKYAKYRTNSAFVSKIYNKFIENQEIDHIASDYDKNFIYRKNETVKVENFDVNINDVCTEGIHFYLTKEPAYYHNFTLVKYTGEFKQWYDSGTLFTNCYYVNGEKHGLYQTLYKNGQICRNYNFKNNKIDGIYNFWFYNGQLCIRCNYVNGELNGIYEEWTRCGKLKIVCNYKNGRIEN